MIENTDKRIEKTGTHPIFLKTFKGVKVESVNILERNLEKI